MDIRNWFVPTVTFAIFTYFMIFVIVYIVKISGPNVSLHMYSEKKEFKQVEDIDKFLGDISKNFRP